jgi:protein phosphatase inhibitor 2
MSANASGTTTPTNIKPVLKHDDDDDDVDVDETMNESSSSSPTTTSGGKKSKSRSNNKKSSGKDKHLKWDEAKIKEHDELRGTRMKIEEPNTPFAHYDSGSETDGSLSSAKKSGGNKESISWDALTNKLEAHVAVKEAYPSSPSSHDGGTADEEGDDGPKDRQKELKELEFKEHRKRHYNEMELVRKFRQEHPDGVLVSEEADDNDDDNDDDDNDADDENE